MAVYDGDLLLIQRGDTPFKGTVDALATYVNAQIELGDNKDIPIATRTELGVIKVGENLDITTDGTLSAVIPSGLSYEGIWTDESNPPADPSDGNFWIWDGADGIVLNNPDWGAIDGETVNAGDRLIYDNNTGWAIIPGGGGGLSSISGASPVVVSPVVDGKQEVSMPSSSSLQDGYMPKEAWIKLESIEGGAEINIDPTQSYAPDPAKGTLTLSPGGDTTDIPLVDDTNAGLMSPTDKQTLDNLVTSPGGVLSLNAGFGIEINTTTAPGTAGTPEIIAKFHAPAGGGATADTLVMPHNIQLLDDLPA